MPGGEVSGGETSCFMVANGWSNQCFSTVGYVMNLLNVGQLMYFIGGFFRVVVGGVPYPRLSCNRDE